MKYFLYKYLFILSIMYLFESHLLSFNIRFCTTKIKTVLLFMFWHSWKWNKLTVNSFSGLATTTVKNSQMKILTIWKLIPWLISHLHPSLEHRLWWELKLFSNEELTIIWKIIWICKQMVGKLKHYLLCNLLTIYIIVF